MFNKDSLIGIFIALFCGVFGAIATFSFDVTSLVIGSIGMLIGVGIGAALKEWRRGKYEERPKNWYVPYIIGAVLAEVATYFMWTAIP